MARPDSSRLYLLAPNLYATSREAWEYWQSLTVKDRTRYLQVTRTTGRNERGANPAGSGRKASDEKPGRNAPQS